MHVVVVVAAAAASTSLGSGVGIEGMNKMKKLFSSVKEREKKELS